MKKILLFITYLVIGFTTASAQKVTLTFEDVSLSEALKRIDKVQDAKRINFIFVTRYRMPSAFISYMTSLRTSA